MNYLDLFHRHLLNLAWSPTFLRWHIVKKSKNNMFLKPLRGIVLEMLSITFLLPNPQLVHKSFTASRMVEPYLPFMALTQLPSSIGRGLNPRTSDFDLSTLPLSTTKLFNCNFSGMYNKKHFYYSIQCILNN